MNAMLASRSVTALLVVACTALGGVVAERIGEFETPRSGAVAVAVPSDAAAGLETLRRAADAAALPPLASLSETVDRPLFSETRRPKEVAEAPSPAAAPTLNVMLTGVVITGDKRLANIRTPDEPRVRLLSEGDSISNWRIDSILPDRVILSSGQRIEHVLLRKAEPPEAARPERASKPRRPDLEAPLRAQRRIRGVGRDPSRRPN